MKMLLIRRLYERFVLAWLGFFVLSALPGIPAAPARAQGMNLNLIQTLWDNSTSFSQNVHHLSPTSVVLNAKYNLVLHPGGRFLYGSCLFCDHMERFNIAASGRLTSGDVYSPQEFASDDTLGWPEPLALSPDGRWLFAGSQSGVLRFAVGDNGELSDSSVSFVEDFVKGAQNAILWLGTDTRGEFLFTLTSTGAFTRYDIDTNGTLHQLKTYVAHNSFMHSASAIVHPDNRYLYLLTASIIKVYRIMPDGSLAVIQELSSGDKLGEKIIGFSNLAGKINQRGNRLYVASLYANANRMYVFNLGSDGMLTDVSIHFSDSPVNRLHSLTLTPDEQLLYVESGHTLSLQVYELDETGDVLNQWTTSLDEPDCIDINCNIHSIRHAGISHLVTSLNGLQLYVMINQALALSTYQLQTSNQLQGANVSAISVCEQRCRTVVVRGQEQLSRLTTLTREQDRLLEQLPQARNELAGIDADYHLIRQKIAEEKQQLNQLSDSNRMALGRVNNQTVEVLQQIRELEGETATMQLELELLKSRRPESASGAEGGSSYLWHFFLIPMMTVWFH